MPLVGSKKHLFGGDTPAQKYSLLTSVFDQPKLYNLTTTHNVNED